MQVRVIADHVAVGEQGTGDVGALDNCLADFEEGALRAVVVEDQTVEPQLPPLLALWPYLALPPLVVGIFLVQQWLRQRSLGTARGGSVAARRGGAS